MQYNLRSLQDRISDLQAKLDHSAQKDCPPTEGLDDYKSAKSRSSSKSRPLKKSKVTGREGKRKNSSQSTKSQKSGKFTLSDYVDNGAISSSIQQFSQVDSLRNPSNLKKKENLQQKHQMKRISRSRSGASLRHRPETATSTQFDNQSSNFCHPNDQYVGISAISTKKELKYNKRSSINSSKLQQLPETD